jgi:hypothetical protein
LLRHRSHQQSLPATPRVDREDRHPPALRPSGSAPARDEGYRPRDRLVPNIAIPPAGRNRLHRKRDPAPRPPPGGSAAGRSRMAPDAIGY